MCICINCRWVDRCITYHDVENNHGVDHICDLPDFKAKKPFIHVNIVRDNNGDYKTDWDVPVSYTHLTLPTTPYV